MNDIAELVEAFRAESDEIFDRMLENLRSGASQPSPAVVSWLLDAVDALRTMASGAGGAVAASATESTGEETRRPKRPPLHRTTGASATGGETRRPERPPLHRTTGASATGGETRRPERPPLHRVTARSLRVGIDELDRMLELTGEIAIARGLVRQLAAGDEHLLDAVRELDRLSFDLQELVMRARMVALGPALRPFQRVVRDVAESRQKRVALVIDAGDVEVDSTVIEQLRDPITHMLRNAIDHGIETPAERLARGKEATGTIRITASHDRNGIEIRLSDDGAGLDEERIALRARELGLEPSKNVIFEPGFSTAGAVTDLSGRGVGMDIVRQNVEALRGTISVASERGAGTTITIRLPLAEQPRAASRPCRGTYVVAEGAGIVPQAAFADYTHF